MRLVGPRSRLVMALSVVLAASLVASEARAQDPKVQAAKSFAAGSEAYARKDFSAAARAFEDAYRIAPRGAAAYNAGLAWESAGEHARAADDYTQALEASDLGAAERADATGRLRGLERRLGRLTLSSPTGTRLTLDDLDLPGSTADVHLEPGKHAVRAEYLGGRSESRSVVVRAGAAQSLKLGEAPEEPTPPAATPPVDAPPDTKPPVEETHAPRRHEEPEPPASPDRLPAWIAFGGAAVASGLAIVFFEVGISARNRLENDLTDSSLRNEATTFRAATWVTWALAGGAAVTGVVLYLSPPGKTSAPSVSSSPAVSFDGHGIALHLRF
jgi:hypothetical protein